MGNPEAGAKRTTTLSQYFEAVDRRLEKSGLAPTAGFRVRVCDQLIDLRFPEQKQADDGRSSMEGFLTDDPGEPDASFLYWYDRCDAYLPAGEAEKSAVWKSADATGTLCIGTDGDTFVGCDFLRQRYYFARPEPTKSGYIACRHAMVNAFARWALATDKLLLHAAAVGTHGKGVLVAGRGGSGKSTFAISCLSAGLDFVSDDYTLLTASGPLRAMPLYTVVALRPDMFEKMPQLGAPILEPDGSYRGGKPQVQVPKERFCSSLDIQAIIMPRITGEKDVAIVPTPPGKAMVQLIHSTIGQIEMQRDTGLIQQMAMRFSGLPVYEMRMSTDLEKNPAALREFIRKTF